MKKIIICFFVMIVFSAGCGGTSYTPESGCVKTDEKPDAEKEEKPDKESTADPVEGETRKARCTGLPDNAEWNTVSSVTQTYECFYDGCEWMPDDKGTYNKTPKADECRFKCVEDYFWTGSECVLDPCDPNPCADLNHSTGKCLISEDYGYTCECLDSFTWNDGRKECLNPCEPNPCVGVKNSTEKCKKEDDFTQYSCECSEGFLWSGEECLDPCSPNPCRDKENLTGICNAVDAKTYTCECEESFTWDENSKKCLNPCEPNPCVGVANSTEICNAVDVIKYSCECKEGFSWENHSCDIFCSALSPTPCKDSETGLMWSAKSSERLGLEKAKSYCEALKEGGFSNWRLPSIDELRSLIDGCSNTKYGGKCKVSAVNGCLSSDQSDECYSDLCKSCGQTSAALISKFGDFESFWSISSVTRGDGYIWVVDFNSGGVYPSTLTPYYFRCVR
ncbi:DUF1566 domain-containing protein [bacterium]|nr:DUF1566 domain-containing protein [bacterium]